MSVIKKYADKKQSLATAQPVVTKETIPAIAFISKPYCEGKDFIKKPYYSP